MSTNNPGASVPPEPLEIDAEAHSDWKSLRDSLAINDPAAPIASSDCGGNAVIGTTSSIAAAASPETDKVNTPTPEHEADELDPVRKLDISPGQGEMTSKTNFWVSLHEDADLHLRVCETANIITYFIVLPALVAAACPPLRDLIDSKKPYVIQDGKVIVDLAGFEDNPDGLEVILSIIHYQFHEVPSRPDVDTLYSVAQVVEKYECARLLVPFIERWVSGLDWKDDSDDDKMGKMLFIAWVIGEGRWFARMLIRAAQNATLDDNGCLLDSRGQPWKNHNLPFTILGKGHRCRCQLSLRLYLIADIRYDRLSKVLQAVDGPFQELMKGDKKTLKYCRAKDGNIDVKQACQHQQLGLLVIALSAADLLPPPSADQYNGSVAALAEKLQAITVHRFKLPGALPHQDAHMNCGIRHHEAIEDAMSEAAQLPGDVVHQLRIRAQTSGLFIPEVLMHIEGSVGGGSTPDSVRDELRQDGIYFRKVVDKPVADLESPEGGSIRKIKSENEDV